MADRPFTHLDRPPLDEPALVQALRVGAAGSWWRALSVVEATDSTNADLVAAAHAGAEEATVLVAEHQRAGRGRLGRVWQAPARSALTLSVLVRPRVPASRWPWLPLLTGVVVAEAVREVAGLEATLKWPNDVLVGDRKLAGVLVERVETPVGAAGVLGMGVNVTTTSAELPLPTATSLALERAINTDRHTLLVALLRTLEALHQAWALDPGSPRPAAAGLHASYVRRCNTLGRQVRVRLPDGVELSGRAEAVDGAGRLVLATVAGRRLVAAGDVLHVRQGPVYDPELDPASDAPRDADAR